MNALVLFFTYFCVFAPGKTEFDDERERDTPSRIDGYIAVIGTGTIEGQIYRKSDGCSVERHNFGHDPTYFYPAVVECGCRVYTIGGKKIPSNVYSSTITEFNPIDKSIRVHPARLNVARAAAGVACVNNGADILVCGGWRESAIMRHLPGRCEHSCELCSLNDGVCTKLGLIPFDGVSSYPGLSLSGNLVYAIKQWGSWFGAYDLQTDTWLELARLPRKPRTQSLVTYRGKLITCQVKGAKTGCIAYNPATNVWDDMPSTNQSRWNLVVHENQLYAIGGSDNSVEVYDEDKEKWTVEGMKLCHSDILSRPRAVAVPGNCFG